MLELRDVINKTTTIDYTKEEYNQFIRPYTPNSLEDWDKILTSPREGFLHEELYRMA